MKGQEIKIKFTIMYRDIRLKTRVRIRKDRWNTTDDLNNNLSGDSVALDVLQAPSPLLPPGITVGTYIAVFITKGATPVPKDAERHWDVNLILFTGATFVPKNTEC